MNKNDRVEIQFGTTHQDPNLELDFLREDVDRSIKNKDTRQNGTTTTAIGVAN